MVAGQTSAHHLLFMDYKMLHFLNKVSFYSVLKYYRVGLQDKRTKPQISVGVQRMFSAACLLTLARERANAGSHKQRKSSTIDFENCP